MNLSINSSFSSSVVLSGFMYILYVTATCNSLAESQRPKTSSLHSWNSGLNGGKVLSMLVWVGVDGARLVERLFFSIP